MVTITSKVSRYVDYIAYLKAMFDYYENVSRSVFHRQIRQVFLIHDSELTAECLDELLTDLEQRGYRFISLEQALADPAYATPDLFIGPQGFSWLIRWKLAFGQKADWQNEPDPPQWIMKMSNEIRRAKGKLNKATDNTTMGEIGSSVRVLPTEGG